MEVKYNNIKKDNSCTRAEDVPPGTIFRPYGEENLYLMTEDYESYNIETGMGGGFDCETPVQLVIGYYTVEGFSD